MPTEQEDTAQIEDTWEATPSLQDIIQRRGMTWFQRSLRKMYDGKHLFFLKQTLAGVLTLTVNNWGALRAVVNDRASDPIDRRELIQSVLEAIASEDAVTLGKILPVLIASEAKNNDMPIVPEPAVQP
jgi:hypothetical protein